MAKIPIVSRRRIVRVAMIADTSFSLSLLILQAVRERCLRVGRSIQSHWVSFWNIKQRAHG